MPAAVSRSVSPVLTVPPSATKGGVASLFVSAMDRVGDVSNFFLKPIQYGMAWAEICAGKAGVAFPKELTVLGGTARDTKNFLAGSQLIKNTYTVAQGVGKVFDRRAPGSVAKKVSTVGFDLAGGTGNAYDFVKVLNDKGVVRLSQRAMTNLLTVAYAGLGAVSGRDTVLSIHTLATNKDPKTKRALISPQRTATALTLGKAVSYSILAGAGLGSAFGIFSVAPWIFLACASSALVFSILSFIHNKTEKPEEKAAKIAADAAPLSSSHRHGGRTSHHHRHHHPRKA